MQLSDIKPNPNNPRFIRDEKYKKLVQSLKDFPKMLELRPMVIDENNIVLGGNMRLKALQELGHKEIPEAWFKRAKELTDKEKERFIIADNLPFGEWDMDILANEFDSDDLKEWGFDIDKNKNTLAAEEIEGLEQSIQIEPPKEYILIMCEPNSDEWEELKMMLKLKMVKNGGYKKESSWYNKHVGLERVLWWSDFKERYK